MTSVLSKHNTSLSIHLCLPRFFSKAKRKQRGRFDARVAFQSAIVVPNSLGTLRLVSHFPRHRYDVPDSVYRSADIPLSSVDISYAAAVLTLNVQFPSFVLADGPTAGLKYGQIAPRVILLPLAALISGFSKRLVRDAPDGKQPANMEWPSAINSLLSPPYFSPSLSIEFLWSLALNDATEIVRVAFVN